MVSKEEENFLRIVYLYHRVATGALTRFFDKLHPHLSTDLNIPQNKVILQQLHHPLPGRKRVLYQEQWNILYPPPGTPPVTSANLDLTLFVCLLRNLPPVVVAPVNGFDELPIPNETSNGADIARLKYYKNFLVSHSADGTLSDGHFVSIWNTLEQAITGLDNSKATAASLIEAKTKMLDNSMVQIFSTQTQLDTKILSLHNELEQTKEHVEVNMKVAGSNIERHITEVKKDVDSIKATTESWLDNTVTNAEIHIEGYNIVRLDNSKNGGGMCVFIREDIAFSPRQDLHDDRLEALWIDILIPNTKTITIGTVYRPPKEASFLINFEEILNKLNCQLFLNN